VDAGSAGVTLEVVEYTRSARGPYRDRPMVSLGPSGVASSQMVVVLLWSARSIVDTGAAEQMAGGRGQCACQHQRGRIADWKMGR
jgi:hypothetical protein